MTSIGVLGAPGLGADVRLAAGRLGVELGVLAASPAVPPHEVLARAAGCEVITVDTQAGSARRWARHVDALVGAGCAVRPNPVVLRLADDPVDALRALDRAGFPVSESPSTSRPDGFDDVELAVLVARRPSGWHHTGTLLPLGWDDPAQTAESVRLATSIADGVDVAGVLTVGLVAPSSGRVRVQRLSMGPPVDHPAVSVAAFEAHLLGVLDRPLPHTALTVACDPERTR